MHIHVQVIKYKLCNFNDSTYMLNTFIFEFNFSLHNIKINSKIHLIIKKILLEMAFDTKQ